MNLKNQKRIAAQLLKVGKSKVRFNQERLSEIKEAITKSDLRSLIKKSVISANTVSHQSKVRARIIKIQKSKGRRKGHGSRKGTRKARMPKKLAWMLKVRSQRNYIKDIREKTMISPKTFRSIYLKIKGNQFRSKRHVKMYLEENKLFTKK